MAALAEAKEGKQKPVADMSVDDVVVWLGSVKLAEFADAFRKEFVDGPVLLELDAKALTDMGSQLHSKVDFVRESRNFKVFFDRALR